ncbi:MAG TPA: sigma-54 dependent transcriptional regulator [Candidatus Marinimicrobia bacterium]|nr:sigma-54 dependent transcriptional regulator [Candidatus Neomarinimicrobiota bacterium]HRS52263.1 sigma-54 dependent transcriptional regulator [Candidatus Neomarinimicrobiota bacterium]HRU91951.1 sigma-54 dependent transcriptional regulator [Candidatus Neomarinimicrobiota bacterium]
MNSPKSNYTILIVEDNQSMREGLLASLQKEGYTVTVVADGQEAWSLLQNQRFDLIITDIKMPGLDGLTLMKKVKNLAPTTDIILITAFPTVDIAVDAMKCGAQDFITKPFALAELRQKVEALYRRKFDKTQASPGESEFQELIGNSPAIRQIRQLIAKIAPGDSPILITGESGVGKELVARLIHRTSRQKNGPFLAVNCGALTETLLESELFGHEKGAFTGAHKTHIGKFEQSNGGTLFLDEIGDMSTALQVKLLRVLQTKQFQRVGGEKFITSDFRLICATNKNLEQKIKDGEFRSDLYYRINVIPLTIPPLRERPSDIPLLVDYLLRLKADRLGRQIPRIEPSVMARLMAYSWPGNVRELENFIERALVFIEEDVFSETLFNFGDLPENTSLLNQTDAPAARDLTAQVGKIEREMIIKALRDQHGVKQRAAEQLRIKPSTLYYKLDKYGIKPEEYE